MTSDQPRDETIDLTGAVAPLRPVRINGNGNGSTNGDGQAAAAPTGIEGVSWTPAYDRATVERYLETLDAERSRLEAEIADAERRTIVAREALATRTAELEAALGAVVLAARSELDRIEREQQEAVAAIRADAEAEAARIREAAREEAETVRRAAASLGSLSQTEGRADAG